jgi:hypothetical protein
MRLWSVAVLGGVFAVALATAGGCGREVDEARTEAVDGSLQATGTEDAGSPNRCRACQAGSCRDQVAACGSDPACARYLSCLARCPSTAEGTPLASCEAACASGDAGANVLVAAVRSCEGAASCPDCQAPFDAGDVDALACEPTVDEAGVSTSCDYCIASRCCAVHLPCANFACEDGRLCIVDCEADGGSASACLLECYAALPDVTGKYAQDVQCITSRCNVECNGSDPPCNVCLQQHCARQAADVAGSLAATLLFFCLATCTDGSCYSPCVAQFPGGAKAVDALFSCNSTYCATACGGH